MLGLLLAVSGLRHPLPPAPSTSTGFPALLNTVLTLALWTLIVLLGAALGRRILQWFRLPWASPNESLWFELPTGLIGLGYPVYALGMTGHFHRSELAVLFIVLVAAFGREIHEAAHHIWQGLLTAWMGWLRLPPLRKLLWGWMILLGAGSFLLALTPPTSYDALWYHLQAPRLFLNAGRIYPEWNNWPANYAFAASMLYALPMALGSDIAPKLLHWTFGLTLLGLIYQYTRSKKSSMAWMAPAFMLTMFGFVHEMSPSALSDNAAGCLELMALLGLLRATRTRDTRWLHAAGLWAGLASSVKMSSLPVLALGVLFWMARGFPRQWLPRLRSLLGFLGISLLAVLPWYLKNALWFGTPIFPAGLPGLDVESQYRLLLLTKYTNGDHGAVSNRLLRLFYLINDPQKLGYVSPPAALPAGLLLFSISLPYFKWMDEATLSALRMFLWAIGPPRIRFLIVSFALWGVVFTLMASHAQHLRSSRLELWVAKIWFYTLAILLPVTVLLLGNLLAIRRPWRVISGWESQVAYLQRVSSGYRGLMYMKTHLASNDRVLLIGDARHYYCPQQCYPEADQFTWPRLLWIAHFDQQALCARLRQMGITHLWLHYGSIGWLLDHDPGQWMHQSWAFFQSQFAPSYTKKVYADDEVALLQITCSAP